MPTFTLTSDHITPGVSVRQQLTLWHVPRKWQHLLRINKSVLVAGQYQNFNEPVPKGALITLNFSAPSVTTYIPEADPLTVVYENKQFLVVDKPAGMKTHPNQPGETGTMLNLVAHYLAPSPAYITHRLDMATSGLLLVAKNPLTQALIDQQLSHKTMSRAYIALVPKGLPESGTIDLPIGRDPSDKRKRMVTPDGERAVSHYQVLDETAAASRLYLTLETGRTHQLRVHLAALGYPILGDPLYQNAKSLALPAKRLMLHGTKMQLTLPLSEQRLTIDSPAPF